MNAPPPWRRISPASFGARLSLLGVTAAFIAALILLIALPLLSHLNEAQERAALLTERANALERAADARRAEALLDGPEEATIDTATLWLDQNAPARDGDAAMLYLISTIRLIAESTQVTLSAAAPLEATRAGPAQPALSAARGGGLTLSLAEARITTDHGGLARFLTALERTSPALVIPTLDITAATARADAEDGRLSARVTIGALSRAPE